MMKIFFGCRLLCLKLLLFAVALFFALSDVEAQNKNDTKITIEAKQEKLGAFLVRLSAFEGVNISFNPSDDSFNQRISYSASEKNIENIFADVLPTTNHDFKKVGNHWVIFSMAKNSGSPPLFKTNGNPNTSGKKQNPSNSTGQAKNSSVPDTIVKYVEVPVPFIDTLMVDHLITKTDTVLLRDTVFVNQPEQQKRRTQTVKDLKNIFRLAPDRENGWAISFSYAQLLAGYSYKNNPENGSILNEIKNTESVSFRNFSLGTNIQYKLKNFSFAAGLKLTGFSHKFSYADVTTSGGYFAIDTLDVFYTIVQTDTNYIYVTDSSWIPKNTNALTYDRNNQIGLLEFHLGAGYNLFERNDVTFYLNGGIDAGVPVWINGSTILNEEGFPAGDLSKDVFAKWTFAFTAGFGGSYKLSNWADVYGEVFYKRYISEFVETYPLERRMHGAGLKIGFLYYL